MWVIGIIGFVLLMVAAIAIPLFRNSLDGKKENPEKNKYTTAIQEKFKVSFKVSYWVDSKQNYVETKVIEMTLPAYSPAQAKNLAVEEALKKVKIAVTDITQIT